MAHRNRDRFGSNFLLYLALLLLAIVVLGAIDLVLDEPARSYPHLGLELGFILLCFVAALYLGVGLYREHRELRSVRKALRERQEERDAWRARTRKLLAGLGRAIDSQLRAWSLTAAERGTALLLLKGYSHKAIARMTDRSERTVRQHAVAVYRKSGLAGRAELSAFFLEDLLLPLEGSPGEESPPGGDALEAPDPVAPEVSGDR